MMQLIPTDMNRGMPTVDADVYDTFERRVQSRGLGRHGALCCGQPNGRCLGGDGAITHDDGRDH